MIMDGKKIAQEIQVEQKKFIETISARKPALTVILVGNNPASEIYTNTKTKACEACGIVSEKKTLPEETTETELLNLINSLNKNSAIDGILVQLPLPKQIDSNKIIMAIDPNKDVDGLSPLNIGKLMIEDSSGISACTPLGIQVLLKKHGIETAGKNVVILGRSAIVGKPLASLLMSKENGANATVTVAHGKTKNIEELSLSADILISAIGKPHFVTEKMVKKQAVVVDVGINRIDDPHSKKGYKIVGDVNFEEVSPKCSFITPVPGGVGPMTIAMLLNNTIKCYLKKFPETCLNKFVVY